MGTPDLTTKNFQVTDTQHRGRLADVHAASDGNPDELRPGPDQPHSPGLPQRALSRRLRHRQPDPVGGKQRHGQRHRHSAFRPPIHDQRRPPGDGKHQYALQHRPTGRGRKRRDRRGRLRLAGHPAVGPHHRRSSGHHQQLHRVPLVRRLRSQRSRHRRRHRRGDRADPLRQHGQFPLRHQRHRLHRSRQRAVGQADAIPTRFHATFRLGHQLGQLWRSVAGRLALRERCPATRSARTASSPACSATASPATSDKSCWPISPTRPAWNNKGTNMYRCRRQFRIAGDQRPRQQRHPARSWAGPWKCPTPTWAPTSST